MESINRDRGEWFSEGQKFAVNRKEFRPDFVEFECMAKASKSPTNTDAAPTSPPAGDDRGKYPDHPEPASTGEFASAGETLTEQFMKLTSANPRFRAAAPAE